MSETHTSTPKLPKTSKHFYFYYSPKPTVKVCLKFPREEVAELTLAQLTCRAISILKEDYLLELKASEIEYCVYPATRMGGRRDGYPELDKKMRLGKISFRRFYLQDALKSVSLISTEFNLERKYGLESKASGAFTCCSSLFRVFAS